MKIGNFDINPTDPKWDTWAWSEFQSFYANNLKGITNTIEEVAKLLGVNIPDPPKAKKSGNA